MGLKRVLGRAKSLQVSSPNQTPESSCLIEGVLIIEVTRLDWNPAWHMVWNSFSGELASY